MVPEKKFAVEVDGGKDCCNGDAEEQTSHNTTLEKGVDGEEEVGVADGDEDQPPDAASDK